MDEKKVEYIELIYDLIFVYLVGRSNSLLHNITGGFFSIGTYFTYINSTLVILQVWFFSMLFINRYGKNSVLDHIGIFINMYLLYYMARGTRTDWSGFYTPYHIAWGLILINLGAQYFIRLRQSHKMTPWEDIHLKHHLYLLLAQAAAIFISIPVYAKFRIPLSWTVLILGFIALLVTERIDSIMPVNFEHLSERVMLYVVFTFGEMIVGIASYFDGGFSLSTVYFSLSVFLIVTGLFVSYGFLYNNIIDREKTTTGTVYMIIHILLVIALNNITVALEFMREGEVNEIAKNVFLTVSFLAYYAFILLVGKYARKSCCVNKRFLIMSGAVSAAFVGLMALSYRNSWVSIIVSVVYVYAMFGIIVQRKSIADKACLK